MPTPRILKEHENDIHFLTLSVIEWLNIFTKEQYFQLIINSLKFCQINKGLLLYEYVIMTNHLHLIASVEKIFKLSQIISDFKKYTTIEIYKSLKKDKRKYILNILNNSYQKKIGYHNQVWQRENWPEFIESDRFLEQKVNYIHNNPVRSGYVVKPEDWKYSSARNRYNGDNSLITLEEYPS